MLSFGSGSAGEEVCQGGEKGGVMLPEFEDFARDHSFKDLARRSESGGGSTSLARQPAAPRARANTFMVNLNTIPNQDF